MKKDLGVKPYTFPMPVLMIATYGENDKVDVMNMAWGGVCARGGECERCHDGEADHNH